MGGHNMFSLRNPLNYLRIIFNNHSYLELWSHQKRVMQNFGFTSMTETATNQSSREDLYFYKLLYFSVFLSFIKSKLCLSTEQILRGTLYNL